MVDGVTSAERRTIRTAERRERETIIERRGPTETDSDQREVGARFVFCADDQNRDRRRARAAARAEKSRPRRWRRRTRDPGDRAKSSRVKRGRVRMANTDDTCERRLRMLVCRA